MREAIGGTWLFQIVILFVLLFAGYMCLSINHSKAFNVKNEIIQTIQTYKGIDLSQEVDPNRDLPINDIVDYLSKTAYRTGGRCPEGVKDATGSVRFPYQGFTYDGKVTTTDNAAFCIAKVESGADIMNRSCGGAGNSKCVVTELPDMSYYRVVVFYQLDLPIFRGLFNFTLYGDTKLMLVGD